MSTLTTKNKGNIIIDDRDQFLMPVGRILFHDLFVPKAFQEGDKPKYGVTMIFPPEEVFQTYKDALNRLKKHPSFMKVAPQPGSKEAHDMIDAGIDPDDIVYADDFIKGLKKAIKKETNTDTLEKYPAMKGQFIARMNAYFPPTIIDASKQPIKVDQKELIYSGCYGQALVTVGIHNKDKVFLRLVAFQKQKNGEPLGRASANVDIFTTFTEDAEGNGSLAEDDEV